MTKTEAIELFGGKPKDLAVALRVTVHRIYQMPETLSPNDEDRVIGAAVRLGKLPAQNCECRGGAGAAE